MRDDVDRVGDDQEYPGKTGVHDRANERINDFFGEIERIEARLPLLRWRSGGDHNNIGVAAVLVIADGNLYVASQIVDTITQVHHLAVCALLIDVDQQNFVADALCQQAERGGRSD